MPATFTPMQEKVRAALAADPKRTAVLAGLSVVLFVVCIRAAVQGGPSIAAASPMQSQNFLAPQTPLVATASRLGSSNALVDWLSQPKPGAKRNLFAMPVAAYTRDARGPSGPAEPISPDESAKSDGSSADQNRVQDGLAKQAAKLKLQSTFLGPTPMALVNGQLIREGDTIDQFQVVRIEPRRIVVEHDGITLQISMD